MKTCVFHWPGASWPPTSDSENLFVIDGTVPGTPGMAAFYVEGNFFFGASPSVDSCEFIPGVQDASAPCVVEKLPDDLANAEADTKADVAKDRLRVGRMLRRALWSLRYSLIRA